MNSVDTCVVVARQSLCVVACTRVCTCVPAYVFARRRKTKVMHTCMYEWARNNEG